MEVNLMTVQTGVENLQLEAKSPFELRANLSKDVPESAVKAALDQQARWDFCIRSRPAQPLMGQVLRVGGLDGRVSLALPLLSQPGHVEHDERHAGETRSGNRGAR